MVKIKNIPKIQNLTGTISVIEKKIKFKIKRVYFIHKISGKRGGHKHKKTKQFLICVHGKCDLIVINRNIKKKYRLQNLKAGVLLEPNDWHEIKNISKNAIICVLASEFYNKKDYIEKI